jgi:uncharacterized protein
LGRRGLFVSVESKVKFWGRIMIISAILFILLFLLKQSLHALFVRKILLDSFYLIISSWSNFAFASVLVSLFVVLYQYKAIQRVLCNLAPFGRMSLTNYIAQSILGSFIYYGYGLSLYKYTGSSFSILIGSCVIMIQIALSKWWLKHHYQGPIERLWHKATWI